jgi:hypothetical protein
MKILIGVVLVALALPALAEPNAKSSGPTTQNQAIDQGMRETREKADISMSRKRPPAATANSTGTGTSRR